MTNPNDRRPPNPNHHPPHQSYDDQADPWIVEPETQREKQRLAHESARNTKVRKATLFDKFVQAVIFLVAALELLLGLRFLLRLTAANPDNTFANVIYGLSEPFVAPFSTLFVSPTFDGSLYIFDINLLVAMAAYLALLVLFLGLMRVIADQ
jgi:hypothetical protein